jgi:hypothetical protein
MALSNISTMQFTAYKPGCTQPYTWHEVSLRISHLRTSGKSFRQIAKEDYYGCVSHAVIQRVAAGNEPKEPRIREALGLPTYQQVVTVDGGYIPPGTQVAGASNCVDCGQSYSPNHPRRKKCFTCSPIKGGKAEAH